MPFTFFITCAKTEISKREDKKIKIHSYKEFEICGMREKKMQFEEKMRKIYPDQREKRMRKKSINILNSQMHIGTLTYFVMINCQNYYLALHRYILQYGVIDIFKIFREYVAKRQKQKPKWRKNKICFIKTYLDKHFRSNKCFSTSLQIQTIFQLDIQPL